LEQIVIFKADILSNLDSKLKHLQCHQREKLTTLVFSLYILSSRWF